MVAVGGGSGFDGVLGTMLTARRIVERLVHERAEKRIIVTPMIDMKEQLGPNGIDLRLGTEFLVAERSEYTHFDILEVESETGRRRTRRIRRISPLGAFVLHPKEFALGSTLEFIKVPRDLAARVDGRSTWARKGLQVHSTASLIHPGSEGVITFELQNMGDVPIKLYPGIRIAQVTFSDLGESVISAYRERASAKYAGQARAQESLYEREREVAILREGLRSKDR